MAQVQILMGNKTFASSQALQSLHTTPSGVLLTRALCTGASHGGRRFGVAVAWQSLAWAG